MTHPRGSRLIRPMLRGRSRSVTPDRVRDLLNRAGWADVVFAAHGEPLWFGPDADTTTTFMVGQMQWLFEKLDDAGKRRAEANLHKVMVAHAGEDGVLLGVRCLDRHRTPLRTQGRQTTQHHRHPTAAAPAAVACVFERARGRQPLDPDVPRWIPVTQ